MNKVGTQIENKNGKTYTVLAYNEDRALLVGGWDYVIINDLSYFEKTGAWGEGHYFPFFEDENAYDRLMDALYYFKNWSYRPYGEDNYEYPKD